MDSGDGTGRVGWECLQTMACLGDKTEMRDSKELSRSCILQCLDLAPLLGCPFCWCSV